MSKFTPGSWTIEKYDEKEIEIMGEKEYHIAFCNIGSENAKLISKAPEMYQLIVNMKELLVTLYGDRDDDTFDKLIDKYIKQAQDLLKEIDGD